MNTEINEICQIARDKKHTKRREKFLSLTHKHTLAHTHTHTLAVCSLI
jgi:hypothetical protein